MFIGRTDAEAETPVLWPPDVKNWLIRKDPDAGKDWRQEEKGTTEDEMVGWHHGLDGHEFEWSPGVGDGQGGLACCDSWGPKESDTTEWLNWTVFCITFYWWWYTAKHVRIIFDDLFLRFYSQREKMTRILLVLIASSSLPHIQKQINEWLNEQQICNNV